MRFSVENSVWSSSIGTRTFYCRWITIEQTSVKELDFAMSLNSWNILYLPVLTLFGGYQYCPPSSPEPESFTQYLLSTYLSGLLVYWLNYSYHRVSEQATLLSIHVRIFVQVLVISSDRARWRRLPLINSRALAG